MKKVIGLCLLGVSLFCAFAQGSEPSLAVVTRTPVFNLYASEIKEVRFVDKVENQEGSKYPGLLSANVEINMMLLPNGCDVNYVRDEILAKIDGPSVFDTKHTERTLRLGFGTLYPIGSGSTCPGLPARPARIVLELANGIGANFNDDRITKIIIPGVHNTTSELDGEWSIQIKINQSKKELQLLSVTFDDKEPKKLAAYRQTLVCQEYSNKSDSETSKTEPVTLVIEKPTPEALWTGSIKMISAKSFGDQDAREATLSEIKSPWGDSELELIGTDQKDAAIRVEFNKNKLGWLSSNVSAWIQYLPKGADPKKNKIHISGNCKTISLEPVLP